MMLTWRREETDLRSERRGKVGVERGGMKEEEGEARKKVGRTVKVGGRTVKADRKEKGDSVHVLSYSTLGRASNNTTPIIKHSRTYMKLFTSPVPLLRVEVTAARLQPSPFPSMGGARCRATRPGLIASMYNKYVHVT